MSYDATGTALIEPELLWQELRSGRALVIVDVRTLSESCDAHIEGSRLIPLHELVARACELAPHRSEQIVLVSGEGLRARIAASGLRLAGFDEATVLAGGLRAWRELGLPLQEAPTTQPSPAR